MAKLGTPFQMVVADVVRELDRDCKVETGEWVEGPDGRRELDVTIEGASDGQRRRIHIECKDFKPTRRVGIGYVDAIVSKHRDIGFDLSLICSNVGFTKPAIRKATREGIGLIAVLREGDPRIRYRVVEEIYTRKVNVGRSTVVFLGESLPAITDDEWNQVTYKDIPVWNWVAHRIALMIGQNQVVEGSFVHTYRFKKPTAFEYPSGSHLVTGIEFDVELTGGWFAHKGTLDATSGLYDWLRRRVRRAPGAGRITWEGIDLDGGRRVDQPPDSVLLPLTDIEKNEVSVSAVRMNMDVPDQVPPIDELVVEDDLDLVLREG